MPKKFGKQQNQSQSEQSPLLFTMGELDLIFRIDFKEEDLEKEESESKSNEKESEKEKSKNFYKLEDINNLKDLSFIKDNEDLWDRIKLKPGNDNIKLLLIGNKNAKTKVKIEYICFGRPKFEEETEFFEEIFDHVTNKNGLLINKTPLDEGGRFSLKIEMSYGKEIKTIQIGSTVEESKNDKEKEGEENKNNEEENNEDNQEEEEEEEEEDDYEENEAMQQKRIPKFKRSKSVLCNLEPSSSKYNMVYLNYEDFSKIPGNFKIGDMIELLTHFKKKNSTIFINYYKKEGSSQSEQEDEKIQNPEENNKKKSRNQTEPNKEEEEPKEKENEKNEIKEDKIKETKKSNNKKEDPKNKKSSKKELIKETKELNKLYYITDIYFFDSEQAVKLFDVHYKIFTKNDSRNTITKSKLYDYFIKGIATGTEDEVHGDKAGLFLDEFNKFYIVRASKKSANKKEYDSQPYPKVNHKNLKLVSEYKDIIKKNKDECYTLFISSLVVSMASGAPKCLLPEIVYPSYLIGVELVKRKIECMKNKVAIPNEDVFYKVKINLKALSKELEKFAEDDKESGFVLDCTNKNKSMKKEYVSLYDYNLKSFFSNQKVRKDLKDKGFINSKGFIMYDPVYRSVMGAKKIHKKKLTEKEMKTKLMTSIKGIDVPSRIKDKELDSKKLVLKQNIPTDKKIPFIKEPPKPNKKKLITKNDDSSEGSSDEDSSSEKKK